MRLKFEQVLKEKFTEEDLLKTLQSNNNEKKFALSIQLIFKTDKSEFGWLLLKGLDLSVIIDEEFVEDLLNINPENLRLSSRQLFKLITFASNMAIQKHLPLYNSENKQDTSQNHTIQGVVAFIDCVVRSHHKIQDRQLFRIIKMLINELPNVQLPREPKELKIVRADIARIGEFIMKLTIQNEDRLLFLEMIYNMLSNANNEPTPLLSLALLIIPDEMITTALKCFFTSIPVTEQKAKESIVLAIGRLIYWLRTSYMPVPLDIWIIKTIEVLHSNGLYEIVDEVAKKNILQAFLTLLVPVFQSKTLPVVQALIEYSRNKKELLDILTPRILNVLKQMENTKTEIYEPLMELICDALSLVDGHSEAQYKDIINFLELRDRNVMVKKLANGPTSYEFLTINNARVGLQNLGNTCYLNSILQALFMTKQFCREILTTQRNDNTIYELQRLFALMLCSPRPEQNPRAVVNLIRPDDFLAGIQHDSSEFLCSLLDRLHEQEKKRLKDDEDEDWDADPKQVATTQSHTPMEIVPNDENDETVSDEKNEEENECKAPKDKVVDNTEKLCYTYIQKIFGGKICTRYLCNTCKSNSINVDSFRDLQLSFPERLQDQNNSDMQEMYNVQQLLEYYFSTEELNLVGDNQYHCDNCKILCNGIRCTEILEPPKNLILTLKHFRYDSRHHTRSKLLHKVHHDEFITVNVKGSLNTNSTRNIEYKLYAAVVHSGNSLDNGHYYTIAREDDNKWFKFNDSFVTTSSLEELRGLISPNTPYILFYQRMSTATASATVGHPEGASTSTSIYSSFNSFPQYDELPTFLKDLIDADKNKYESEIAQQKNMAYGKFHPTIRNNFDDDNDPGSGPSYDFVKNFTPNRFIY